MASADLITFCDGRCLDFVTVIGQIRMVVRNLAGSTRTRHCYSRIVRAKISLAIPTEVLLSHAERPGRRICTVVFTRAADGPAWMAPAAATVTASEAVHGKL